ncbi:general stress protein [Kineococcus sp. DHX-1]|uniref:general stress protein n=1 Tax=Kineococcus sp. DHX-1 TaxID=3349638 RepID=UPI0036D279DB
MSNLGPMGGPRRITTPTPPSGDTIGRYGTYSEAQRAVDFLSDEHFPVQNVTIVGTGLQMVERVTGRLTYGRAAGAGAASGAWFGLLIGLMLSVFGPGGSGALLTGILVGAGFGMLFGVISYALTGGRRDFTSSSQIVASEYTVLCLPQLAGQAREVLSRLPNGLGRDSGTPSGQSPWGAPDATQRPWGPPPGGTQPYMPPPQPGSGPATQPPPPPSFEKAPEPEPVHDLSGPTYAEKMEEARRQRRAAEAAEARAREEQERSER